MESHFTRAQTKQPSRRQDERDARIEWILDSALDIVTKEGLTSLTTPRLAKQLGYTPAAFYRYFPSKEDLLVALEQRTARRFYNLFFEQLEQASQKLVAKVAKQSPKVQALVKIALLARTYTALVKENPAHFDLVGILVTTERSWMHAESASLLKEAVVPHLLKLGGFFVQAAEVSAINPGDALQRLVSLWLAIHGSLAIAPITAVHPELFDVNKLRHQYFNTLLLGWGATQEDINTTIKVVEYI